MTDRELREAMSAGTWLVWVNMLRGSPTGEVELQLVRPMGKTGNRTWTVRCSEGSANVHRRHLRVATAHDLLVLDRGDG